MTRLLLTTVLLFSLVSYGQSVRVKGLITDTINNPLEFANVIATIKETGDIESYGITNYEGRYQLNLPAGQTYTLRASFLGYETKNRELFIPEGSEDIELDFALRAISDELDEVEIVYEMPVTVKGDTIVYNTDSFTTGDERKLGDVMKKLPGVEVNDEGEIQVEGKTVQKVMVEGKDFFDGDSKLATKNIPADAVDKVEVLRNYNEVDQMRGLGNDQDNVAINVRLKEGKKRFWFGEVTAGLGEGGDTFRYLAHPKLFYYSPEYSINIITDFNNIGEVPFTFRDYFNFTGGFRNFNQRGGTRFNISQSDLGFAVAQNNRANDIETGFLAGNFSWRANEVLDLSGFAILSDNKTNIVNNSIRQFINSGITETTASTNDQRNQLAMLKLSGIYKPSPDFQLDYDALVKISEQTEDAGTLSLFQDNTNNIEENLENRPYSINQNVNLYYTLDDKNIFAGQVQHLWQNEDPFYNAVTDLLPFSGILPVDTLQNRFNINQEKNIRTSKLDAKVDYFYVLNNTSNLNFTAGITNSDQQFDSNIFQLLGTGNRLDFAQTPVIDGQNLPLVNDVQYNFNDVFFGLHYKVKTGQFIFTPGLTLHNYNLTDRQLGNTMTQNDWMLLPDFNAIWNIKKSESLRFNYALSAEYTDINNFARAFVFNNYNRMFQGNRNLENAMSQTYNLTYFNFNLFNFTNISANLSYTRRINGFKNDTRIVAINQVSRPFNIDSNFPDETFSAFGRFSKTIKKLQFSAGANTSLSKSFNQINDRITESQSFTQNYNGSIRSNFREWPNFEVGYRVNINNYDNGGLEQTFFTHRPFANVDVNFLKHFSLNAEWEYYNYSNKANTIENTYSFLNATLYYQKGTSPWEFSLQGNNLLDTEFLNNDSFNEQFNTTSQYFVLPRILMFIVRYEL